LKSREEQKTLKSDKNGWKMENENSSQNCSSASDWAVPTAVKKKTQKIVVGQIDWGDDDSSASEDEVDDWPGYRRNSEDEDMDF
jgi:hypothetical protein